MKDFKKMKKETLIELLEQLMTLNPDNKTLIENLLGHSKPNYDSALKTIEREMEHHQGSYVKAHRAFKEFVITNPVPELSLALALEVLPYFFEELELYRGPGDALFYIVIELFDVACRYASESLDLEAFITLRRFLDQQDFPEDIDFEFHEVFSQHVPQTIRQLVEDE